MGNTIAVSDEAYELLKKARLPGESFAVTIRRNLRKNKLTDIVGSGTISLEDWREARKHFATLFGSLRKNHEAWRELETLRRRETKRLERIDSTPR